jgi:hypothetical protein
MQLRLAHGALQAQQQAIVERAKVVDSIAVDDQGVGQRTQFEQALKVG